MADVKFALLWAIVGAAILLFVFGVNFQMENDTIPGYRFLAYPGIISTRFFSEELGFWFKLGIMLLGQYLGYFIAILVVRKLIGLGNNTQHGQPD